MAVSYSLAKLFRFVFVVGGGCDVEENIFVTFSSKIKAIFFNHIKANPLWNLHFCTNAFLTNKQNDHIFYGARMF
jgi:hypothetical protein